MNLFENILKKVSPEQNIQNFLSGFTPSKPDIFTGKTTSEKIASGEIPSRQITPTESANLFNKEQPFGAGQGGIGGSILRNISKTPSTFDPNRAILTPIETGVRGVSQNLQTGGQQLADITSQHAQKVTNKAYRDESKVKSVVSMLVEKGYDQNTINQAVKKLDDQGAFQDSWINNPVKGTLASVESGLAKGASTLFQGISDIGSAPLQESGTAGVVRYGKGLMETGLGSAQLATSGTPTGLAVNTGFSSDTASKALQPISQGIESGIAGGQKMLGMNPESSVSKDIQQIGSTAGTMALFGGTQKVGGKVVSKISGIAPKVSEFVGNKSEAKAKIVGDKGLEEIYQAVNPTTRENKAVLRQRVSDLLPYIDEKNMFNNDLPKVKERVDAEMKTAFDNMENYESTVGVKGTVETSPIIKALKDKYQEKIGESYLNPDEAAASQKVIDLLKGFGKTIKDSDILKVRRAWDDIIKKNKGFMQSAEANIKGEVFNESNKFFRDEIRKSNPEYAKYLEKAHKTITLSDILEATIQRRTGQTQGGFLRQGLENVARTVGTGVGAGIGTMVGSPGAGAMLGFGATEALMGGVKKLTGSSAKLTKGKKLILKNPKNVTNTSNNSNPRVLPMESTEKQLTSRPRLKTTVKPNSTTNAKQQVIKPTSSDTIPEGYFKNAFGEIQKNPSNKKGGFIKVPWGKPIVKRASDVDGGIIEEKIPKPDEKFLAKFAEGKTLDEFMGFVRGSSTQYGGYEPRLRRYLRPESKRLSELVPKDPNTRTITVYRGIDKSENPRIKSEIKGGDFVTTSYDDALSYADSPANVVSKRVPISTLVTEFPEEFIKNNKGKSIGEIVDYELIWKPYDHPFIKVTDNQLKQIYEKSLSPQKTVKPLTKSKQSATMGDMETKKLIEEARKYKSAEEFVKAQKFVEAPKLNWDTIPGEGVQAEIPLNKLRVSSEALDRATKNTIKGNGSRTSGDIDVVMLKDGTFAINEGHHRAVQKVLQKDKNIRARIYSSKDYFDSQVRDWENLDTTFSKEETLTKQQLLDIYNKANKNKYLNFSQKSEVKYSKPIEDALVKEAKKYKSAEEFVKAGDDLYRDTAIRWGGDNYREYIKDESFIDDFKRITQTHSEPISNFRKPSPTTMDIQYKDLLRYKKILPNDKNAYIKTEQDALKWVKENKPDKLQDFLEEIEKAKEILKRRQDLEKNYIPFSIGYSDVNALREGITTRPLSVSYAGNSAYEGQKVVQQFGKNTGYVYINKNSYVLPIRGSKYADYEKELVIPIGSKIRHIDIGYTGFGTKQIGVFVDTPIETIQNLKQIYQQSLSPQKIIKPRK